MSQAAIRLSVTHKDAPIEVTLVEVNGQQIRVGFEAPKSVKILRRELKERSQKK